jgi:hypothetical protein
MKKQAPRDPMADHWMPAGQEYQCMIRKIWTMVQQFLPADKPLWLSTHQMGAFLLTLKLPMSAPLSLHNGVKAGGPPTAGLIEV